MRLPEWARKDNAAKLKFFVQTMAVFYSRDCTAVNLTDAAGLHYNTVLASQERGRMSKRVATALTSTASGSGVKAIWLIAPELIELDENGEITR